MRLRGLLGVALSCGLLMAVAASAGTVEKAQKPFADGDHVIYMPIKGGIVPKARASNLTNHGGPVITSAHVVFLFWGPSFGTGGADAVYATTLQAFRSQFGTAPEFNTITQYSGSNGTIALTNLGSGTADLFDTSTPPTNVTDSTVRSKVTSYTSSHGGNNTSTIYEVVIPKTSYSSDGSSTSCGGPGLAYCAYHSWIGSGSSATKYSIQPYPSCSGCQVSGFSDVQDQEHFVCHETREAVTDPTGTTWWDSSGAEADDKCAWSPTPFIGTGGYAYQYEWSNLAHACVRTR